MPAQLFRIKEGKERQWREWCNKVQAIYAEEALISIKEEGGSFEMAALFEIGEDRYVMGIGDGVGSANMDRELNKEHKRQKEECLEKVSKAEVLYELTEHRK